MLRVTTLRMVYVPLAMTEHSCAECAYSLSARSRSDRHPRVIVQPTSVSRIMSSMKISVLFDRKMQTISNKGPYFAYEVYVQNFQIFLTQSLSFLYISCNLSVLFIPTQFIIHLWYRVFESFEDNAAQEQQLPPACPTAQSRNLVPISLENPVNPPSHKVFYFQIAYVPSLLYFSPSSHCHFRLNCDIHQVCPICKSLERKCIVNLGHDKGLVPSTKTMTMQERPELN